MSKNDWVQQVQRVEKQWGHEEWFALVDGKFCGKAIHVKDGHSLSLQYQERKEETISGGSGTLRDEVGPNESRLEEFDLLPGESIHLTPSTRLKDRYGRQGTVAG